jgi:zinc transport system ATP-binding protein
VLERLRLQYGAQPVLCDIDLTIEPGTLHAVVGPNGGGKTSLLRSVLGQTPHQGEIRLEWPAERVIGYIPQSLEMDLNLPITVENFLSMIAQDRPVFRRPLPSVLQRIQTVLTWVDMLPQQQQPFGTLSGGQRQRILFAQALLRPPNLLLLDEPLTGLDEAGERIFEWLLDELRGRGVTILWVHHDLEQVRRLADAVTCVRQSVLFSGKPHDVLTEANLLRMFAGARR